MIQGGNFSTFSINFYRTYERGVVDIDIYDVDMHVVHQFSVFFSTKTIRITKIHFGHRVGKYDP